MSTGEHKSTVWETVLSEIVSKFIEAGQLAQAIEVAKTMKNGWEQRKFYRQTAVKFVEAGQFAHALDTVKLIEDKDSKIIALMEMVDWLIKSGQIKKVDHLLGIALEVVKTMKNSSDKAEAIANIALRYSNSGQTPSKQVQALLLEIVQMVDPIESFWK